MKRYDIDSPDFVMPTIKTESPDGAWVRYEDAAAEIRQKDEQIEELEYLLGIAPASDRQNTRASTLEQGGGDQSGTPNRDGKAEGHPVEAAAHREVLNAGGRSGQGAPAVDSQEPDYKHLYYDLILWVATKHPGETRHETAKRYIDEAEGSRSLIPAAATKQERDDA